MEEIILLLAPYVGVIVSTIMGTSLFKRLLPNLKAETVTYIVWGLVGILVTLVFNWFPWYVTAALVLAASGGYSAIVKPVYKSFIQRPKLPGGGGIPRPRP